MGTLLILIPFCIIGIWFTLNPVMLSWGACPMARLAHGRCRRTRTAASSPIKNFIIVAFASLLLQAIAQAIKYLAVLTGHTEVEAELQAELAGAEVVE